MVRLMTGHGDGESDDEKEEDLGSVEVEEQNASVRDYTGVSSL
jgi:hypothetical protein